MKYNVQKVDVKIAKADIYRSLTSSTGWEVGSGRWEVGGGKRIAIISRKSSNYCTPRQQESDGRAFLWQKNHVPDGWTGRPTGG